MMKSPEGDELNAYEMPGSAASGPPVQDTPEAANTVVGDVQAGNQPGHPSPQRADTDSHSRKHGQVPAARSGRAPELDLELAGYRTNRAGPIGHEVLTPRGPDRFHLQAEQTVRPPQLHRLRESGPNVAEPPQSPSAGWGPGAGRGISILIHRTYDNDRHSQTRWLRRAELSL